MRCAKCQFEQDDGELACVRCGVIFAKLRQVKPAVAAAPAVDLDERQTIRIAKELLFPVPRDPSPLITAGRCLLLVLMVIWSFTFLFASIQSNRVGESFMHLVNLPFHEAGHIIFSPLGRFLQVLGGTLGQLLMPAVCLGVLLIQTRDAFGAAMAQWWLAESFMDIAPYIDDARSLQLILLGGVTGKDVDDYHDWEYLLRTLGMLKLDHALAYLAQGIGILLMISALCWAAASVWSQYKLLREKS